MPERLHHRICLLGSSSCLACSAHFAHAPHAGFEKKEVSPAAPQRWALPTPHRVWFKGGYGREGTGWQRGPARRPLNKPVQVLS
eukprot:11205238-Lingulodinium_polyedra.AAC.1